MKLFSELKTYLEANFKGIEIAQPLFFKKVPGLRFDLQDSNLEVGKESYFKEVVRGMLKIHALSTSDSDIVMLLYQRYTYKRQKIKLTNYLFKQVNKTTAKIEFKRCKQLNNRTKRDFNRPFDGYCKVIVKDLACNINFHNLYLAISHMDFGYEPYLTAHDGELYLFNLSKNTITLRYDDRGCDLISYDVDSLNEYYVKLSDLILEASRPQIMAQFHINDH